MTDLIKHQGTVENIVGTHVKVRIVQTSACSSCSAKSFCSSSESKEKLIDIYDADTSSLHLGQEVVVYGTTSMGMRAVGLAFGVPFLVMVAALFVLYLLTGGDEAVSALGALLTLLPYYAVLYALRGRIKRRFSFQIETTDK